jgi:hypothetical protein
VVDSRGRIYKYKLNVLAVPAAPAANSTPEATPSIEGKSEKRIAPAMANPTLPPDKCRAVLAVLCVLYTHAVFCNCIWPLCPAWFAGTLCHTKEATALETALHRAGDYDSVSYVDTDGARSMALLAELDEAEEE